MISVKGLSYVYENISVLKDISFDIEEGDFVAMLGPNGAGKTTLAKLMIGLLPMQQGSIEILGVPIQKIKDKNIIGYMPQRYTIDKLFPGTVKEILNAQKSGNFKFHNELETEHISSMKFIELSGGQQQRVLIRLALQNNPKILILDEPTVGIDMKTESEFLDVLKHLNKDHNITILLITHDVGMVANIANKVLCINHNICCMGPATDTKKLIKRVYSSHTEHHHH